MTVRTSSTHLFAGYTRKSHVVFLSLLIVAGTWAAQQAPPGPTRRGPAARLRVDQLPDPSTSSAVGVEQALLELGRLQVPGNQRLDLPKLSQLAWAIQKTMMVAPVGPAGSTATPAEALLMRAYFVRPEGVSLYNPLNHTLEQIADVDEREALAAALLGQPGPSVGGCQIILTAVAPEFNKRYGTRARTVMVLQAGQMSRSVQLEAIAQGLTFISVDAVDPGAIRRVARVPRNLEPLYVLLVGYPVGQAPATPGEPARAAQTALFVVPSQGFQEEELLATRRALEQANVQVMIASTRKGPLIGMANGTIRADLLLNEASLDKFNAVVLIGSAGTIDSLNIPPVLNLVRQAAASRKVLAASGTAPSILASAGVLKGARATAYLSEQSRITQGGATYTGRPVEKDGLTITSTGPLAVPLFAQTILEAMGVAPPSAPH
jgi:protease I